MKSRRVREVNGSMSNSSRVLIRYGTSTSGVRSWRLRRCARGPAPVSGETADLVDAGQPTPGRVLAV